MKLKVVLNETEEIDLNRIDGLSSLSQSTSNNSEPQYGIVPNTGSIDLVDIDRKFQSMIDAGELPASAVSADIYIDDKLVQKHITTDSTYDRNGNELTISLSNTVDTLNNTVFSGINYEGATKSAYDVLFGIFSEFYGEGFTEDKFKELMSEKIVYGLNDELYGPIYSYLQKITMEVPYVESGKTYKEIVDEFCAMAQLQMYVDTDGYIKATSARPVIGEWDFVIANEHNQMSDMKEDLFVKNNYNGIEILEGKYSLSKEFETTVASVEKLISKEEMVNHKSDSATAFDMEKFGGIYVSYVSSRCNHYMYSGSSRFNKKANNNLEEITKLYDNGSENGLSYSLTYKKGVAYGIGEISLFISTTDKNVIVGSVPNSSEFQNIEYEEAPKTGKIEDDEFKYTVKFTDGEVFLEATSQKTTPTSDEFIKITDEGDTFLVEYNIICGKEQEVFYGYNSVKSILGIDDGFGDANVKVNGIKIEEFASKLEIDVMGDRYVISFNESTIKTKPSSGNVNILTYPSSAFITDKTKYDGVKISSLITNKLLKDYSSGVKTATITTNLKNLSTLHGYNGRVGNDYLIEIGDIVYPRRAEDGELSWGDSDGTHDNMDLDVYKTTGFNLVYDGEILNELELMKVKYSAPMFSFEYDQTTDGYIVKSNFHYSDSTQLIVPETYDDGIHGIKNVSVVGVDAFVDFINLQNITLPSGIKKISAHAFKNCSSLKYVVLPPMLETIGDEAFINCSSLERIDIPDTVKTIFAYAFVGVPSTTVIYCNVTEAPEGFAPHWNAYNFAGDTLKTEFISPLLFANVNGYWQVTGLSDTSVKHLVIPDRYNGVFVTSIADGAFENNTNLRTVDIGGYVSTIGANAFRYCYSLYKVTLGFNVETIGSEAFRYCEKLISVVNKSTVSVSAGSTNNGYIGYYLLKNINIKNIDNFIFAEERVYPYTYTLISYDGSDANITLPTQDSHNGEYFNISYGIYKYAFYGSSVVTVNAGPNVVSFGEYSFANCLNLKAVNIDTGSTISSIPAFLFSGCSLLDSFAIPESVSTVGYGVFTDCVSLKKVYIPISVTTISATQFYQSPFRGCSSTAKIYCGAKSKPSGWGSYWNYYNASNALSTSYGYTKAQYEAQ